MGQYSGKSTFWSDLFNIINSIKSDNFFDIAAIVLDIAVVAIIIYYAILLVRETRAMQLVKSIGVILFVYLIANIFSMVTLKFLLGKTLDYGLVVLVILFQPELRRALERLGRSRLTDFGKLTFGIEQDSEKIEAMITAVVSSCEDLSRRYEGALIVIERETKLGDVISTGTIIDAEASSQLITNLFFKNAPLHDGAMLIRNNRVYAAGCFLPLSSDYGIGVELGTRHRAALGISEVSDSVTIVVSEERGSISVASDSKLSQNLSLQNLKKLLEHKLLPATPEPKESFFKRWGKKKDGK